MTYDAREPAWRKYTQLQLKENNLEMPATFNCPTRETAVAAAASGLKDGGVMM